MKIINVICFLSIVYILAAAIMLHKSCEQEHIVAAAPPPSCLVLHPSAATAGAAGPHSLVTRVTVSNLPMVERHWVEVGGHSTVQVWLGLKSSQLS